MLEKQERVKKIPEESKCIAGPLFTVSKIQKDQGKLGGHHLLRIKEAKCKIYNKRCQ